MNPLYQIDATERTVTEMQAEADRLDGELRDALRSRDALAAYRAVDAMIDLAAAYDVLMAEAQAAAGEGTQAWETWAA